MASDPILVANAMEWLQLAKEDLAYAVHSLTALPPYSKDALFHCQQATEKSLKAYLTSHDIRFRRVHNLDEIGKQCTDLDSSLAELARRVRPLSLYASEVRYPGFAYNPTLEDAESAVGLAREVIDAIGSRLPEEAR